MLSLSLSLSLSLCSMTQARIKILIDREDYSSSCNWVVKKKLTSRFIQISQKIPAGCCPELSLSVGIPASSTHEEDRSVYAAAPQRDFSLRKNQHDWLAADCYSSNPKAGSVFWTSNYSYLIRRKLRNSLRQQKGLRSCGVIYVQF
jgi:hypothetical protein